MRRVYYAFCMRIVQHEVTLKLGLFVLALLTFAKLVHVHKLIENMLNTPVGNVPHFVMNAVLRGEVLTLMAIGVMVFVALSLPRNVVSLFIPKMRIQKMV